MAMNSKTVTGNADELKLVKNGKQAPKTATGGTARPKFTGSADTRTAGAVNANKTGQAAAGYINDGPVTTGDTSFGKQWVKEGAKGSTAPAISVAKEDVTRGMGGKFIDGAKV